MIDTQGRVAAHTGGKCIEAAGHVVGTNYSVQANLMLNEKIWPAMSKAFESAAGDLAERMLAALDAAQQAGGDIRGRQSAALIVVAAKSTGKPWVDRVFDLRVDDSPEPLQEPSNFLPVIQQLAEKGMPAACPRAMAFYPITEWSAIMRKMIMLAIAGWVWKKVQARIANPGQARRDVRTYRG